MQQAKYAAASAANKATILAQDQAWLNARAPVCTVAFDTGGTLDGVEIASCLLDGAPTPPRGREGTHPAGVDAQGHRQL